MSEKHEKRSWSEVDKLKDKGGNPSKGAKTNAYETKRADSQAKKDLDDLFKPKVNPKAKKAWENVQGLRGKEFESQAKAYILEFGYPPNASDLLMLIDIEEPEFLQNLLEHIKGVFLNWHKNSIDMMIGKLRIMTMMMDDDSILSQIESLMTELES